MTGDDGDRDDFADTRPLNATELTTIGPYAVRRFIAEGGFAWVYEVSDPRFPLRRLALKMLKPEAARGDEFRRFESEARMIAGFDHPNLVTVFDLGRDENLGCYYYTMNYVAGPTLSAMGRLSIEDAAPIITAVLAGLTQLHDAHIVHRDIKPGNILTTTDGRAMLADLGIARDQTSTQAITRRGSTIGTPRYMSPEQARGVRVEPASDVFSMGLVLYEVLTGSSVYDKNATDGDILFYIGARFHAGTEYEFPFSRNVPAPIQEVVRKACRMAPGDRYPTAREMREALQRAVGEVDSRTRIRPWQIAAGLGGIAVIGAGAWAGSFLWTRREARLLDGQVLAVSQLAKGVLESVAAIQPPPDYAMLAGSQQQFDTAEVTRQNGRYELDAGRYDDAAIYLRLALQGFETTCERLSAEQLEPQLKAVGDDLDARGKELAALGAESLTPARWQEFQTKRAALATAIDAASTCERSDRIRVRMTDAGEVLAVATQVFTELGSKLPDLARVARQEAEAARGEAIRNESASELYRAVFERGERAFAEGRAAADAGRHVEARDTLRASAADFDEAAKLGGALSRRARVGEAEDRAVARRVRDFGVASLMLSRAEERFAARDWTAAVAGYERAVETIDALVAPPEPPVARPEPPPPPPVPENRPPVLSIAAESSGPLRVGQIRKFLASPTDPDGDAVDVEFSVDAHPASAGPEFSFSPAKPGRYRIAALARDAQGATASDAIDVEVAANRAPKLELTIDPAKDWVQGKEAVIVARARDPEGDPVSVAYSLDGREVARGDTFRFEPPEARKYVVTAVATDALGARTAVERSLTVRALTPPPKPASPPKPAPTPSPPIEKPAEPENRPPEIARVPDRAPVAPAAPKLDVAAQAAKTLKVYAQAYEARDVERLRKVYTLNPQQVRSMSAFFTSADEIRMEIRTLESRLEGESTIVVDFDQKVSAPNLQSPDKFIPLRATLSRQADDRWVIVGIRGR
jgi:tetratricopeptide (TPR) repeat protein